MMSVPSGRAVSSLCFLATHKIPDHVIQQFAMKKRVLPADFETRCSILAELGVDAHGNRLNFFRSEVVAGASDAGRAAPII